MRRALMVTSALLAFSGLACSGGSLQPANLSTGGGDACSFCRMTVSNRRTAAQVVAPGEEPRFFDDVGCLLGSLGDKGKAEGSRIFVADHRTGDWVAADVAVYARVTSVETPMGSHLLAWADDRSRAADPSGKGADSMSFAALTAATEESRSQGDRQ
jgi:copper chaperone NosL